MREQYELCWWDDPRSIEDGVISAHEAKRFLKETTMLPQWLIEMKLHLEDDYA